MTDDEYQHSDADAPDEDGLGGRVPPHSLEAEQSVLGGMMLAQSAVDDVADNLNPGDFHFPKHAEIAVAIIRLHRNGDPVDVLSVTAELERTGRLRFAGGAEYLHQLTSIVPTASNAGYYASIVADKAIMRGLVEAGTRLIAKGYASEGDPQTLVDDAAAEIAELATRRKRPVRRIGDSLSELVEDLEKEPTFLPSPWDSLNRQIGGFERGGLYIVGARPGVGKSIVVLQIAMQLALHGAVAFSSLEMTEAELQQRLLANWGDIHIGSIRHHNLTEQDWKRAAFARTHIVDRPLYVDATPSASISQIRSFVRQVQRREKLSGVVVDYLQIIKAEGPTRAEAVGDAALALKHLAKELDIVVIAAAQLKREDKRGRVRGVKAMPTIEDIRESGAVENHADGIILMDRTQKDITNGQITFVVGKHRHGAGGQEFQLLWEGAHSRVSDLGYDPLRGLWSPPATEAI